ncbi:MAG: GNAT family N-acetyltransferase [Proteobacteria bacterium]|nr:GNAT family N-acetyltransferase [Pseudomonadota bacterium]
MTDLVFEIQDWFSVRKKMEWLFPLHWEEVANYKDKIKLNLDDESYNKLAQDGNLHIVVARDKDKIVGYHWLIIKSHLHYKQSLTAFTDVYFLHRDYRKGWNGIKLFKFVLKTLKEKKIERVIFTSKTKHDKSKIFERLGFDRAETIYTKYIGD